MEEQTISHYIERTPLPEGQAGFPRIVGRRISVVDIVLWGRGGLAVADIAAEYDLPEDAVLAALDFYAKNQEEIDRYIEEGEAFFEAGLQAQLNDPIYLGMKARREALVLREGLDLESYGAEP